LKTILLMFSGLAHLLAQVPVDFSHTIKAIEKPVKTAPAAKPASKPAEEITPDPPAPPPKPPVVLPESARDAVAVTTSWSGATPSPLEGKDGKAMYIYGAGLPVVTCAPLKICVVELEPGEKLTGAPNIGDSIRWDVSAASVGAGANAVAMIVLKPRAPGLDTNLLVSTDRRAYYLRLVSDAEKYVARVGFEYPPDPAGQKWLKATENAQSRRDEEFKAAQIAPIETLENLNSNYRVSGDKGLRPVSVVDDGRKTYLKMSPSVGPRETPVLMVHGQAGDEVVNYRPKGDVYIVDRLIDRAVLVLGVGKHARRAEIVREEVHP
jgi:P-type conjugative transfer protein TrbG